MGTYSKTSGELYFLSGECVVSLSANDEIELVANSDKSGNILTFSYFTTSINPFF